MNATQKNYAWVLAVVLACLHGLSIGSTSVSGFQSNDFFGSPGSTLPPPPSNTFPTQVLPGDTSMQSGAQLGVPSTVVPPPTYPTYPGAPVGTVDPFTTAPQGSGVPVYNQGLGVPPTTAPSGVSGNPYYGQSFGASPYGVQPPPNQFSGTGSTWLPPSEWAWPQQTLDTLNQDILPRVLERPRMRYGWIVGDDDNLLNINELELATTFTWPQFLGTTQPLRISPGFIFHWLDGPDSNLAPGFDLPPRVYSTYIATDHMTDPANNFGMENNFTVGFYSDFENSSSNAIRLTGRLVGWMRINPYTVGKLGVEYFDRIDVKLVPTFGVYMAPNSDIRWDLFFPRTKLAHRWSNYRGYEVWSYIGAEYGGGSWAIDRADGTPDQADINDVRAFIGAEWMGQSRISGFLEIGYVFNREIVYRTNPNSLLDLEDAFMLRLGAAF